MEINFTMLGYIVGIIQDAEKEEKWMNGLL